MGILNAKPLLFWPAHLLFVLVRHAGFLSVNGVADVRLVGEYEFDLRNVPIIAFVLGRVSVDVGELTVARVIELADRWNFLANESVCDAGSSCAMDGKGKNLFNYPACFLVDDYGVLIVRISLVTERCVCEHPLTICKLCPKCGLDLAACVFREPLIGDGLFGKGIDKLEKT